MTRIGRLFARPGFVLLLFTLMTLALFEQAWQSPRTAWVGGLYDPEQIIWFLRWTPWALAHGQNPLLTDHLNAPQGVNLMWNTAVPLVGLVLSPISISLGPIFSYNVFVTAGVALSAWSCWWLLRRVVGGTAAPFAGAALYGFSPYVLSQGQAHANLTFAAIPPLIALALDAVLRPRNLRQSVRAAASIGALAAVQILFSEDLLAVEAIGAGVLLVTLAVAHRHGAAQSLPALRSPFAIAILVFIAFAAFPLGVQFLGPNRIDAPLQRHGIHVADLANVVVPTTVEAVAPQAATNLTGRFSGNLSEDGSYLGIPLLVICVWTVIRRRAAAHVLAAATVGLASFVLALGESVHVGGVVTQIPSAWRIFEGLPLLTNLITARFAVIVDLCTAVLFAEFVATAATTRWRLRVAVTLEALTVVTLAPAVPFAATSRPTPPFFDGSAALLRVPEGSTALIFPMPPKVGADAMLWQAAAGMRFRMPEGYIFVPPPAGAPTINHPQNALEDIADAVVADPDCIASASQVAAARSAMMRFDVSTVVVGPGAAHAELVSMVQAVLAGRAAEQTGGVDVWFDVAGSLRSKTTIAAPTVGTCVAPRP